MPHFFFKCLVAEAVWHSACWGFSTDEFWISSNEDIVNLVLNPPNLSCTANEIWFMEFSTLTNQSTRLPPPPSFASWVPPPTD